MPEIHWLNERQRAGEGRYERGALRYFRGEGCNGLQNGHASRADKWGFN